MARPTLTDTRARILGATWRLMEETEDLTVRIADIAAASGVSRQAVYLHFGNRAQLLLAAVQYRDAQSPTDAIRRAAEEEPVPEALGAFVAAWFAHIPRIEPVAHLLSAASQVDAEARVAFDDRMNVLRRNITALANRLAQAGALKPGWTAARAVDWIWHRTHLVGWRQMVGERGWTPADYTRTVSESLQRDLLVRPDGQP